jgi:hypothetical protein
MDVYGFLRIPMDSYGFLWIPMDSYGFLRIPMDFYSHGRVVVMVESLSWLSRCRCRGRLQEDSEDSDDSTSSKSGTALSTEARIPNNS